MPNRAEVKSAHELSVLRAGLAEHNRIHNLSLSVISQPDPPDAILSDGLITTWMELTDAFFSPEWARDLNSYATDEQHKPMAKGLYMNMDAQLASAFCEIVIHKYQKSSYKPFIAEYGPGILVVGLESPWLGDDTIDEIDREWASRGNLDISETFSHVYIGYRNASGNHAFKWPRS
jgi:hypothetical protein